MKWAVVGGEEIDGLAGLAVGLMDKLGLVGAAIAVAADNFFPPIPSEIVLPMAGFAASQGTFSLAGALIATTIGSLIGAIGLYWIGAAFGRDRVLVIFQRTPLLQPSDLLKTESWFARHGGKAVFFGRFVPIFRTLVSIPAGVERMNFWFFTLLSTVGSLLWNAIFVIAGYRLGANWVVIEPYADAFQWLVIGAVVVVIATFVIIRLRACP